MKFKFKFFLFIVALLSVGCSKTTVVLLDNGKTQNAVIVSTNKGSSKLDKVGNFVDLKDKEKAPSEPKEMSKEELQDRFSKVLAISPKKPVSFILYFKPNSMELVDSSNSVLDEAVKSIAEHSPCMVDIIGHTDSVGSNEINIKVSLKRAKRVESLIKSKGINVVSLVAKGYGEEDLLVPTPDNIAEEKNRNVEIFIK